MTTSKTTRDHDVIREWAERRKGHPAVVKSTHQSKRGNTGLLRIDFDPPNESLDPIEWDEFFETFDKHGLAFLYQDKTASGRVSRFNKFVAADTAAANEDDDDEDVDVEDDDEEDESYDAADDEDEDDDDLDEDEDLEDDEYDEDEDTYEDDEDEDEDEDLDEEEDEEDEEEDEKPKRRSRRSS